MDYVGILIWGIIGVIALSIIGSCIVVVKEYERAIVFTLGKYSRTLAPGFHLMVPVIDRAREVDVRIRTIDVKPQDVITKDNVTIMVDAVVFFNIFDAKLAVCAAEDYMQASTLISQTTLRDVVGQYMLDEILGKRDVIAEKLRQIIDVDTDPWGVKVTAVELKQVVLPDNMKRVMAAEAEAEREKRAKLIHAQGELDASTKLAEAAKIIAAEPTAFQLRFMQTLTELAEEKTTVIVVPMPNSIMESVQQIGQNKQIVDAVVKAIK